MDVTYGPGVPGLNSGKFFFFSTFLVHIFYPVLTALSEYLDPAILHLFCFCFITLYL